MQPTNEHTAQFVLLMTNAKLPTRGSPQSVGYDLYSAQEICLAPHTRVKVLTDIALTPPQGHYGQILSRSGLAANKSIDCHAGVIDPDYTGNITVLLNNSGDNAHHIHIGDKIAQLVFIKVATLELTIVDELDSTERATQGFGSTDIKLPIEKEQPRPSDNVIRTLDSTPNKDTVTDTELSDPIAIPYDIILSEEPYDHYININIDTWGDHPMLGLILDHDGHHMILKGMAHSTPGHRIPRHKSTLLNATPMRVVNSDPSLDQNLTTRADLEESIHQHRDSHIKTMTITFGTINPVALHPQTGNPQIHQDQLNAVQKVLLNIKHQCQREEEPRHPPTPCSTVATLPTPSANTDTNPELSQTFTLKQLKQRSDWQEWRASQFKELQQYADQDMFGAPEPLPTGANALHLLWTYVLKVNGTKKARCVCNGNRNRGAVTLGHIFANALSPNAE
jgi:dUTP pyrophosphatase